MNDGSELSDDRELSGEAMVAIESCRPDSDDARLPEVASALHGESSERIAARRRSVETIDRAVKNAVQQVTVPEGLAERILAAVSLDTTGALDAAGQELLARPADGEPIVILDQHAAEDPIHSASWRPSRRLVFASLGVALAASLLVVVGIRATRDTLDPNDVLELARAFYQSDDHAATLEDMPVGATLPVATNMVTGKRSVTLLGRSSEAYELSARQGRIKGTLYVIPLGSLWGPKLSGLSATRLPQGTLGLTVAVWQSGTNVYVMVVKGDNGAFNSFFSQKLA